MCIVDEATPETAQVAKLQNDFHRWMAARMDPGSWSESKGAQVSVSIQQLHLEAVKELSASLQDERPRSPGPQPMEILEHCPEKDDDMSWAD